MNQGFQPQQSIRLSVGLTTFDHSDSVNEQDVLSVGASGVDFSLFLCFVLVWVFFRVVNIAVSRMHQGQGTVSMQVPALISS